MARPGPQTMAKRQRELKKLEKRRAKEEKKALRRALRKEQAEGETTPPAVEDRPSTEL